jgi:GAF domain-containing protein
VESHPLDLNAFDSLHNSPTERSGDAGLERLVNRLAIKLSQDQLVQQVTQQLRHSLDIDRVALYYFYRPWQGQVTFESISDASLSILGMTGADECFNQDYAQMYLEGRVRAIPDIEQEAIHDCHREFLQSIRVKANLVVPVLTPQGLWGLLAAHHCQAPRPWNDADIATMRAGAKALATSPSIATAA